MVREREPSQATAKGPRTRSSPRSGRCFADRSLLEGLGAWGLGRARVKQDEPRPREESTTRFGVRKAGTNLCCVTVIAFSASVFLGSWPCEQRHFEWKLHRRSRGHVPRRARGRVFGDMFWFFLSRRGTAVGDLSRGFSIPNTKYQRPKHPTPSDVPLSGPRTGRSRRLGKARVGHARVQGVRHCDSTSARYGSASLLREKDIQKRWRWLSPLVVRRRQQCGTRPPVDPAPAAKGNNRISDREP